MVLLLLALPLVVDLDRYRTRIESAASDTLGMDVRISGRLRMGLLPRLHVGLSDVSVLGDTGDTVASSKRVDLSLAPLALIRGKLQLDHVELIQPTMTIERDLAGRINIERLAKATALLGTLHGARVSLTDGRLAYADRRSGSSLEATGIDLSVTRLRFEGGEGPTLEKGVELHAELACRSLRAGNYSMTDLKARVDGKEGRFHLEPVTMELFGGSLTAQAQVDLSGPVPTGEIRCSLPGFRVEELLRTLSPESAAEGTMDFSSHLMMSGRTLIELKQSVTGEVSLRGRDLTLIGSDLDLGLSRFRSSQNFSLVDVGAVLLAGPLGVAVTKGYNFASLIRGSGGNSHIGMLVSDWKVERGVATAHDVALATPKNRMALQGGLDLVHEKFVDVTLAVVDAKGCASLRQVIRGSFAKPEVEKPGMIRSLAGPVLKLAKRTRNLLPGGACAVFYAGSVTAPN